MLFVGAILAVGVLFGWGLGGGVRHLAGVEIRWWPAAPIALLLQVAPAPEMEGALGRVLPVAMLLTSYAALLAVAAVNWRLWGFILIATGISMNMAVIAANGGMPVSADALRGVGADEAAFARLAKDRKHHLASDQDVLRPLADVIPVGRPFEVIVSAGDLLAYAGAAVFLGFAMNGRPARQPGPPEPPAPATMWGTLR